LTHDQHVAALEDIATRGCACADAACLRTVDATLAELIREIPLGGDPIPDAQLLAGMEALGRYLGCAHTLDAAPALSFHDAFVARLQEAGDLACACGDAACVAGVWGGFMAELYAASALLQEDGDFMTGFEPQWRRIEGCTAPILGDAAEQALIDLTALRAAACACTTAECADAVQADVDAFLAKNEGTTANPEQGETIGRLSGEMNACLEAARGEAGTAAP
jgi:hypothetical protein